MHEEFRGRAGEEGFYFAIDYQAVGAVFWAGDELLDDEGAEWRRIQAFDVSFCFFEGWQKEDGGVDGSLFSQRSSIYSPFLPCYIPISEWIFLLPSS